MDRGANEVMGAVPILLMALGLGAGSPADERASALLIEGDAALAAGRACEAFTTFVAARRMRPGAEMTLRAFNAAYKAKLDRSALLLGEELLASPYANEPRLRERLAYLRPLAWSGKIADARCPNECADADEATDPDCGIDGDVMEAEMAWDDARGELAWARVPAGFASIGCEPADVECFPDELPAHKVNVGALDVMRTEATSRDLALCVAAGACPRRASAECVVASDRTTPASCVSHTAAALFCVAVGGRLPSAIEWEHVAKGAAAQIFPWGNEAPAIGAMRANHCDRRCPAALTARDDKALPREERVNASIDDGFAGFAPVGSFPRGASPQGAQDLAGNVREWTASFDGKLVEVRGGSYIDRARALRASNRMRVAPEQEVPTLGFRCVRSAR